ncbi:lycopene cyclase domain-containing protein [Halobellus captivus]|uniref:lycopene cyclase domain-containing protein n=1 Tax=Halobellus captivus TaxID=2592614 RepID=UPI0011A5A382|nr:lycopene cyclase domain-containing protein [Halobellus captivus]
MSTGFTYLQFHLVFLVPVVATLVALDVWRRSRSDEAGYAAGGPNAWRNYWAGLALVTVVALAYTTPWDNSLVARGVWWYGDGVVFATVGYAPVEEYLFILIQPVLTGLWLAQLTFSDRWPVADHPRGSRFGALALAIGIGLFGWRWLGTDATVYLGSIAVWAAPVLALQWVVGAPQLWARRRVVALGTLPPTLYLCVADRIAIEHGVWILSSQYTTGFTLGGLPIEEGAFFLLTNLFVVQGLVLYRLVTRRRARGDELDRQTGRAESKRSAVGGDR